MFNSTLGMIALNETYRYFITQSLFKEDYIMYKVSINNKNQLLYELSNNINLFEKVFNLQFIQNKVDINDPLIQN